MEPRDMVEMAAKVGRGVVDIPRVLQFNNVVEEFPNVCVIGNIDSQTNTYKENHLEAKYWH